MELSSEITKRMTAENADAGLGEIYKRPVRRTARPLGDLASIEVRPVTEKTTEDEV